MNFESAYEYASGEIHHEDLRMSNTTEIADRASTSSQQSDSTAASRRQDAAQAASGRKLGFGKFQLLAVIIMTLGLNSGSFIILPLAYLEMMPQFKCEYERSTAGETLWQECEPAQFCHVSSKMDG